MDINFMTTTKYISATFKDKRASDTQRGILNRLAYANKKQETQ